MEKSIAIARDRSISPGTNVSQKQRSCGDRALGSEQTHGEGHGEREREREREMAAATTTTTVSRTSGAAKAPRRAAAVRSHRGERAEASPELWRKLQGSVCSACAAICIASASVAPSALAETRLPPLDTDPMRCDKAYDGNTLGMANGLSDKLLDFRFCDLKGAELKGKTLSAALMSGADFSKANMVEVVMSKAYAVGANFEGANLQNSVLDRVEFKNANLRGVNFINAVITGIDWEGADVTDAIFDDALISVQDVKNLCINPTLKGDARAEVGCKN